MEVYIEVEDPCLRGKRTDYLEVEQKGCQLRSVRIECEVWSCQP